MTPTITTAKTKPMTADEFLDWVERPENANGFYELVRGEVIELPPPIKIHGLVASHAARLLWAYCIARNFGYVTSNDSGVILERDPDTVRGPDVAVYEDAASFDELHPKYGEVPPVLAVEVLSPSDRPNKVTAKVNDYLRNGVKLVWVIDPDERTVAVHALNLMPQIFCADGELTGGEVLPGLGCRVADLFFVPGPPAKPEPPAS